MCLKLHLKNQKNPTRPVNFRQEVGSPPLLNNTKREKEKKRKENNNFNLQSFIFVPHYKISSPILFGLLLVKRTDFNKTVFPNHYQGHVQLKKLCFCQPCFQHHESNCGRKIARVGINHFKCVMSNFQEAESWRYDQFINSQLDTDIVSYIISLFN